MKGRAAASLVLVACALVAGCARRLPPPENLAAVAEGYDAYRTGDQKALEQPLQRLAARLPADRTSGPYVACSPEGFALRRAARAARKLEYLDDPTLWSLGEDERFVYFQQLVQTRGTMPGALDVGGPTNFECERAPDCKRSLALDVEETAAIR